MTRAVAVLVATVLALSGCGGSDEPQMSGHRSPGSIGDDSESLAAQTGCEELTEEPTEQPLVREKFACDFEATVYTFNDDDGKSGWLDVSEMFGTTVLDEGDLWVKVEAGSEKGFELPPCPIDEGEDAFNDCVADLIAAGNECADDLIARWNAEGFPDQSQMDAEVAACFEW